MQTTGTAPAILTTTVGSYSPIDWLAALPSEQSVLGSLANIDPRIDKAAKKVGVGRIGWVHPDCGFWMLKRSIADRKIEALVLGRDKYLGR
ncbi:MAG: hypothetical protein PHD76_14565 [Methylacidiphilales bacterium]|nr:hypothetical protein [Candidatus Methylacidiphilales bacterium]